MPAEALSTELVHSILRHLSGTLHAEEKKALLHCALVSRVFLGVSREVLLPNLPLTLDCNSPDSALRIPAFFDLLLHPCCSLTRPLSLNLVFQPTGGQPSEPHWQQARRCLIEGIERFKGDVKIDSLRVEIGTAFMPDSLQIIQAVGEMASACIRRLDVLSIWEDAEFRAWMEVVSHGKCSNLQELSLRFQDWISDFGLPGQAPPLLRVLKLSGGASNLWISFLDWVERGGAVIESLSLDWMEDEDRNTLPFLIQNALSHHVTSHLKEVYFDGAAFFINLAHLPTLDFVSICVDQNPRQDPIHLAAGTVDTLLSLKQHKSPLTLEIYITMPSHGVWGTDIALDDFLVTFLQERRNVTDAALTIDFRDSSRFQEMTGEELASWHVPKLKRLTTLTTNDGDPRPRRWTMRAA